MEPLRDITADSKGRIPLGVHHAGERYVVTKDENGQIILEKAVLIPQRELWLHENEQAKKSVLKGLKQAQQKNLKSNLFDLDGNEEQ